jgi:hypothetical protein
MQITNESVWWTLGFSSSDDRDGNAHSEDI